MNSLRSFVYSLRWYFVGMMGLFLLCSGISFYFSSLFSFFDPYLEELFTQASTLEGWHLFWFIFWNNVRAAFVGMIGGIAFGLIPVGIGIMNGLVLGYVGALVTAEVGLSSLWRLLPHGIFELPALFLALALGLRLGVASGELVYSVIVGKKRDDFMQVLRFSCMAFIKIVMPLLLLAGIIESWLISAGV